MGKTKLNQYQQRQEKRRSDRVVGQAGLSIVFLYGLGYFLLGNTVIHSTIFIVSFIVISFALITWLLWRDSRKHNNFEFGEQPLPTSAGKGSEIDFHKLTPRQFEEIVAQLIARQGYRTKIVGGAGDQGVDIKVYNPQGQFVGVVQCKRYRPNKALAPAFVREMDSVKRMHGVSIAYLATTAYFTEETKRLAQKLDVRLIDGRDLRHIARKVSTPMAMTPSSKFPFPSSDGWSQSQSKDVAPVAPHWGDPIPQRRFEQDMPSPSEVRNQPPVARETPGWNYADDPPPITVKRSRYDPRLTVEEQRQLRRMGRDKALRRQHSDTE